MADDHAAPAEVDLALKYQVQRRPFQRILLRALVDAVVIDRHLTAPRKDKRVVRRIIFEPRAAWAFQEQTTASSKTCKDGVARSVPPPCY